MKANDMVANNYFGHVSPDLGTPDQMIRNAGITFIGGGEVIAEAANYSMAQMNLMNSPEHYQIIMGSANNEVGVAVVPVNNYVIVVEEFIDA